MLDSNLEIVGEANRESGVRQMIFPPTDTLPLMIVRRERNRTGVEHSVSDYVESDAWMDGSGFQRLQTRLVDVHSIETITPDSVVSSAFTSLFRSVSGL